jgi:CheY-like chemotaxis protein
LALPHLLLVDDSATVLAQEAGALSAQYTLSTAGDGREALGKMRQLKPAAVLLDLTMPEMGGEEVLQRMAADEDLRRIPVIVISSETGRTAACLGAGARAFLPKPIRARELLSTVARVIEESRGEHERAELAVIFVSVDTVELAIPISFVKSVLHQITTRPLPVGPSYLNEFAEVHGEPVLVLDLARRLGVAHARPIEERKLLIVESGGSLFALCVDAVREPEEIPAADLVRKERLGGADQGPLQSALLCVARTQHGPIPVVDPGALVSSSLLRELRQAVALPGAA